MKERYESDSGELIVCEMRRNLQAVITYAAGSQDPPATGFEPDFFADGNVCVRMVEEGDALVPLTETKQIEGFSVEEANACISMLLQECG